MPIFHIMKCSFSSDSKRQFERPSTTAWTLCRQWNQSRLAHHYRSRLSLHIKQYHRHDGGCFYQSTEILKWRNFFAVKARIACFTCVIIFYHRLKWHREAHGGTVISTPQSAKINAISASSPEETNRAYCDFRWVPAWQLYVFDWFFSAH